MKYRKEDLERLHEVLYEILGEIVRICNKHNIPYFIQGGSAIGAFYNRAIVPWDDDIDVGMLRRDYDRFLEVAPSELQSQYFLEWFGSEPNTPFYFAKVKKNDTLFVEEMFRDMDIHHGIFVDIFPYDEIPNGALCEKIHRARAKFWINCFMGKQLWLWGHCGKCQIDTPLPKSWISCIAIRLVALLASRGWIYRKMNRVLGAYNGRGCERVNIVRMPRDQIRRQCIERSVECEFGPLRVMLPDDVESYLRHHYPNLRPVLPESEQINHAPYRLSFDTKSDTK